MNFHQSPHLFCRFYYIVWQTDERSLRLWASVLTWIYHLDQLISDLVMSGVGDTLFSLCISYAMLSINVFWIYFIQISLVFRWVESFVGLYTRPRFVPSRLDLTRWYRAFQFSKYALMLRMFPYNVHKKRYQVNPAIYFIFS